MNKVKFCFLGILLFAFVLSCTKTDSPSEIKKTQGIEIVNIDSYTDRISIEWEPLPGATKYEIRYAQNQEMNNASVVERNTVSALIEGLAVNQNYIFEIRGFVSGEWSSWSEARRIATASFEVAVATYNILSLQHDPNIEPEYAWALRRDAVRDIILQSNNDPDIIGMQECNIKSQYDDVIERLETIYDYHISGRNVSNRAIFWKKDKFELVSSDDNIDILPGIDGYSTQRYATLVRLREKNTKKQVLIYNIHLPNGNSGTLQSIRGVGAEAVATHAKRLADQNGIPAIILGDFNNYAYPDIDGFPPAPIVFQAHGITDTFDIGLKKTNSNYGTQINRSNSTASIDNNNRRHLDYILGYPHKSITVPEHALIINFSGTSTTELERPVPSDHHPVRAVMHLSY